MTDILTHQMNIFFPKVYRLNLTVNDDFYTYIHTYIYYNNSNNNINNGMWALII